MQGAMISIRARLYVYSCDISFSVVRPTTESTLFPYTTLFRSVDQPDRLAARGEDRAVGRQGDWPGTVGDRKSTRLNSSHVETSYAVFGLKKQTYKHSVPYLEIA